jgi:hypothetical protein
VVTGLYFVLVGDRPSARRSPLPRNGWQEAYYAGFWWFYLIVAVKFRLTEAHHRHFRKAGCCRNCGYDLRASEYRCPECGDAISRRGRSRSRSAAQPRPDRSATTTHRPRSHA